MDRSALYYPFHLCSGETLEHLMSQYALLHFGEYMALQLTNRQPLVSMARLPWRLVPVYQPCFLKSICHVPSSPTTLMSNVHLG